MDISNFYEQAIRELKPRGKWCIYNNSLDELEWQADTIPPTRSAIEKKAQQLYDAYLANPPEPDTRSPLEILQQS